MSDSKIVVLNTDKLLGFKLLGASIMKSSAKVGKSRPVEIFQESYCKSLPGSKVGEIT